MQAQERFELTLPATALNAPLGSTITREALGEIAVYADGQLCTIENLTASAVDVVVELGLPGHPAACGTAGSTLSFLNGSHSQLQANLTLGTDSVLSDFTPLAPGSGATILVVPQSALATSNEHGTMGGWLETLTARAGDAVCTSVDVSRASRDAVLPVGLPGQPQACATPGTVITIVDGRGFILAEQFQVEPGTKTILSNLAPLPPHEQPSGSALPTPSPGTSSPIQPPSVGSAGLAR